MSTTATAYEVTYIVRPNLEEADFDAKVEKIAATLKDNGAQLGEIEKLGKRRLACVVSSRLWMTITGGCCHRSMNACSEPRAIV